jgi:cell division protein ZapA (FtsZ GTPase activity inhibitor)
MTEAASNVVTIDGEEYEEAALADDAKYFIAQIRDLQSKQSQLRFQSDQLQAALNAMTNALISSVKPEDELSGEK